MEFMGQLTHVHASLGGTGTEKEITTILNCQYLVKHKQWRVAMGCSSWKKVSVIAGRTCCSFPWQPSVNHSAGAFQSGFQKAEGGQENLRICSYLARKLGSFGSLSPQAFKQGKQIEFWHVDSTCAKPLNPEEQQHTHTLLRAKHSCSTKQQ